MMVNGIIKKIVIIVLIIKFICNLRIKYYFIYLVSLYSDIF